jgi:serine acetyltransferase
LDRGSIKARLRFLWVAGEQARLLIHFSRAVARIPLLGRPLSLVTDNLILHLYGMELTSTSLSVNRLVIGHSTGVVLGGNGIRCTGTLHVSSGVVFARRYSEGAADPEFFFDIEGDVTIGANSVLLGPLKIRGPVVIGALSLVSKDIVEPGSYVGQPVRRLEPRIAPVRPNTV